MGVVLEVLSALEGTLTSTCVGISSPFVVANCTWLLLVLPFVSVDDVLTDPSAPPKTKSVSFISS